MDLLKYLIFPTQFRSEAAQRSVRNMEPGREGLWRFGISGDLPVVCTFFSTSEQYDAAESLIRRHAFLTTCGISFDLVFIMDDGGDYRRPRSSALWESLRRLGREGFAGVRGGVHFAESSQDTTSLISSAAVILDLDKQADISEQNAAERKTNNQFIVSNDCLNAPAQSMPEYIWNDGFSFKVNHSLPPRAWGNILTNGEFGFFATDCGTGHMWYKNAREFRINRWLNDPLAVHGTETLELLTPTGRHSLFASPNDRDCSVIYKFGAAIWEKRIGDVHIKTTAFVPLETNTRVLIIETKGMESEKIAWFTELVLAGDDNDAAQVITTIGDNTITAKNPRASFQNERFMMTASAPFERVTCDRNAWMRGEPAGESGAGFDPCIGVEFPASGTIVIVTGCDDRRDLIELAEPGCAFEALAETLQYWKYMTGCLKITTPDPALDRMINGWSVYQTLACRIMGRTSIYQSGGAYGFRDQLQDVCNLLPFLQDLAKKQILTCCSRQFEEGDVLHWWHETESMPRGVRTRCSDDLVWLPWAVCEYTEKTGDLSLLGEKAPYLRSEPLKQDERERYETPSVSPIAEDVLGHAQRAIELVIERGPGAHGLILMGGGDWNDGMDKVGELGIGESVWLTWFFSGVTRRFAALLERVGDKITAKRYNIIAADYARAANAAWDGKWYLRGYYDDGSPLGSADNVTCQIDSIAQSFSVYCPEADPKRRDTAIDSAIERLFDRENSIIRLFDPPFINTDGNTNPGYIESYGPGFRENGGQYTHGSIWLAIACLKTGRVQDGYEILSAMLPERHDPSIYGAEPFVIAADVYTAEGTKGRAGWSWYTGSSGWFHRAVTEELLGLRVRQGRLYIEPCIPESWDGFSAVWRLDDDAEISIKVSGGVITVNGDPYDAVNGVTVKGSHHAVNKSQSP